MSGDVLDEFACLRVVCNESGGNGGCYQPQGGKTQIVPEELFQIFRKRFCSLGSMPGRCSEDTEELFIPHESLLPGTVLGPADPQS